MNSAVFIDLLKMCPTDRERLEVIRLTSANKNIKTTLVGQELVDVCKIFNGAFSVADENRLTLLRSVNMTQLNGFHALIIKTFTSEAHQIAAADCLFDTEACLPEDLQSVLMVFQTSLSRTNVVRLFAEYTGIKKDNPILTRIKHGANKANTPKISSVTRNGACYDISDIEPGQTIDLGDGATVTCDAKGGIITKSTTGGPIGTSWVVTSSSANITNIVGPVDANTASVLSWL